MVAEKVTDTAMAHKSNLSPRTKGFVFVEAKGRREACPVPYQQQHLCPCLPWSSQPVASVSPTSPSPISAHKHKVVLQR